MYNPVNDGIQKDIKSVVYLESKPPDKLADLVHNYWELKTTKELSENFLLHKTPALKLKNPTT